MVRHCIATMRLEEDRVRNQDADDPFSNAVFPD